MSQDIYSQLFSAEARSQPVERPRGGTAYVYEWTDDTNKDDWRADGYRWRQSGSMKGTRKAGENQLSRMYLHVRLNVFAHLLYRPRPTWAGHLDSLVLFY